MVVIVINEGLEVSNLDSFVAIFALYETVKLEVGECGSQPDAAIPSSYMIFEQLLDYLIALQLV